MNIMAEILGSLGATWCRWTHSDPMWPVNGEYQCRVCLRKFRVRWEQPETPRIQKRFRLI